MVPGEHDGDGPDGLTLRSPAQQRRELLLMAAVGVVVAVAGVALWLQFPYDGPGTPGWRRGGPPLLVTIGLMLAWTAGGPARVRERAWPTSWLELPPLRRRRALRRRVLLHGQQRRAGGDLSTDPDVTRRVADIRSSIGVRIGWLLAFGVPVALVAVALQMAN